MTPERFRRVEELYNAAMELGPDDRDSFVVAACGDDKELCREVALLLAEGTSTDILPHSRELAPRTQIHAARTILAVGTRLGPYQIVGALGEGGMAMVYRALDVRLGRVVAIKVLDGQFGQRFDREARAISSLNHPNICTLHDVGSMPNGASFLVIELVEGETLREWSKHSPDWDCKIAVIRQMSAAIRAAHEAGIVHRDLKPANVMIRADGFVKVLDFGLAKRLPGSWERGGSPTARDVTLPGQIVGTVAYMSPEQLLGQDIDARSDLFALGIIFYELLAGRYPWAEQRSSLGDTMHAILHNDPLPIEAALAGRNMLAPEIGRAIMRCLEKRPEQRIQNVADLEMVFQHPGTERATVRLEGRSSIAILPFANVSADKENEYFGDGLAEEVINALANVPGLKVAARTSSFFFKGKDIDLTELGRRLNVEHVLEGSVRKSGTRIRVTAQLIKIADGFQLWSERYDRDMTDIFAIQDEITQSIASVLRIKLSPATVATRRHVPSFRAYEAYLQARHLWFNGARPELLKQFKELLERAIELDPKFALPYSFLGLYYTMQANLGLRSAREVIPLAQEAEQAALRIDPSLNEAHALLACCLGPYHLDWNAAERHWRSAMNCEPVSRDVLFWYGHYLLPIGRTFEAIDAMSRGMEGDPLNLLYRHHFARGLRLAGKIEEAEAELIDILAVDASFALALTTLGSVYAQQKKFREALLYAEKAQTETPWSTLTIGLLAGLLVRTGSKSRADDLVERLTYRTDHGGPAGLAMFHAICGELDRAAAWGERAIKERDVPFVHNLGPFLKPTPWWPELTRLMKLPG
jgi:TolB-like protein/Tfp pilus assembly protein PilF